MCKALDAAYAMINWSIDLAVQKNNPRYYMDYSKLNKLLYIAQCQMLATYNRPLFDEDVHAHWCGPRVDGIDLIPIRFGFNAITQKIPLDEFAIPSIFRLSIIDWTLQRYGMMSIEELVEFTKATPAYEEVAGEVTETSKPILGQEQMAHSAPSVLV